MATKSKFATAILSGALVFGGLSVASAHHGDVSEHSTTKGKSLAQIERMERQITADLNRKAAAGTLQLAQSPTTTGSMQMGELVGGAQGDQLMPMAEEPAASSESDQEKE